MPTFEITAPDGKVYEVTGPEGATAEQALAQVQAQYGAAQQGQSRPMKYAQSFLRSGPAGLLTTAGGEMLEGMEKVAVEGGGLATDLAAQVAPPEVAGAIGAAVRTAPTLLGGGWARSAAAPAMDTAARAVMKSALKPDSIARASGDAAAAIDTLLKEGASVTAGGAAKLRGLVNELHADVAKRIADAGAKGATVDKGYVGSELYQALQKFRNQVNPEADVEKVLKSWDEFNRLYAAKIPVEQAQALKQGTYRILSDKYARTGAVENEAATQAQMAEARGLRKGIEDVVPGVGELNARESALINALELAEKRSGVAGNRDLAGIAWLVNHPGAAAAMLADRSPLFKSILARLLYEGRGKIPFGVGAGATGVATEEK